MSTLNMLSLLSQDNGKINFIHDDDDKL